MSGWAVQYASATGETWAVSTLPTGTVLQPGMYGVVLFAQGGGASVPHAVRPSSVLRLGAAAGKIALTFDSLALTGRCPLAAGNVADFVGYGTADCSLGGPAPGTSPTDAISRRGDGCHVESNATDFEVHLASPHDATSSTVCACAR